MGLRGPLIITAKDICAKPVDNCAKNRGQLRKKMWTIAQTKYWLPVENERTIAQIISSLVVLYMYAALMTFYVNSIIFIEILKLILFGV